MPKATNGKPREIGGQTPSAKDPEWAVRHPDKSTVEVQTLVPWEHFKRWDGTSWRNRGRDYEAFKLKLQERLVGALFAQMPQLRGALLHAEMSTPLSTKWFQQSGHGEIYGLNHDLCRFDQAWLHSVTQVPGLFLTGQDAFISGVAGALMAGIITASALLGGDAVKLKRLIRDRCGP